ncbi:hypothetical protein ACIP88_00265 [Streptomyces uncialis]
MLPGPVDEPVEPVAGPVHAPLGEQVVAGSPTTATGHADESACH